MKILLSARNLLKIIKYKAAILKTFFIIAGVLFIENSSGY